MSDTAYLIGDNDPTGTITFTLYLGTTLLDTEIVAVNGNGPYSTHTGYTLPISGAVTGTYQWNASYSGDANNDPANDTDNSNEQVVVKPALPVISTTPAYGSSPVTLLDTADLSNGYYPTGTITFTLYLRTTLVDTETVAVNGNGPYSTPTEYTALTAGQYQWNATYSGDANNDAANDIGNTSEQLPVPVLSTLPNPTSVTLGSSPPTLKDTAYLIGDNDPTGTITFTLSLGTTLLDTEIVAVNGNGPYSTHTGYTLPISGAVTGTYQWNASYSGDANNDPANDTDNSNEQVVVKPALPVISTTPAYGSSPVTLLDTADLSNGYYPTGTITFTLYLRTTLVDTETVAVNGNGMYSTPTEYTALTAGQYQWNATYSGDANNDAANDIGNTSEQLPVPVLSTLPNPTSVTPGSSPPTLKDTAYLIGDNDPTGTITFTLSLGTTLLDTETVAVNGNGPYSTHTGYTLPISGAVTGTYQWNASYSGDANNDPANDTDNSNEQVVVKPALPVISTTPAYGSSPVTLLDTADLSNGYYPTGTITFTLYLRTTLVDTETVAVNGNGPYSTPTEYTALTAGQYQWNATYSGDANNDAANDIGNTSEQLPVPVLSTLPNPTSVTLGSSPPTLKDTAYLIGDNDPTGTITFTLYLGTTLLDTETVAVNGNGPYSTHTGYTLPISGESRDLPVERLLQRRCQQRPGQRLWQP